MAKEDEKLKIGTNGRHFLFAECPTMQISIPTTGNGIYSGAMKNYHVTHFSSRSSFCRFCPNIPSCNYTWATLILWGKYTQSFYQTNSGTYMHPVKISNQSQDLTGFLLQATGEVIWTNWTAFQSTIGSARCGYRFFDETHMGCNATSRYSFNDGHPRLPPQLTWW